MIPSRVFTMLALFVIALASRLVPHPPNCTAVNAIALLGTLYLGSVGLSLSLLFSILFISDFIIGFHSTVLFVYLSIGLIATLNSKRLVFKSVWLSSLFCSLIFFLITNFGEWCFGTLYPKTLHGLTHCFLAALPFFGNQVCGDLFYCAVLMFGFRYCTRLYNDVASAQ